MKKPIKTIKPKTCKYIEVSEIVPEDWKSWFFAAISQNAPFSWGDNNRTMVDAISFGHHVEEVLDVEETFGENTSIKKHRKKFFNMLNDLEKKLVYIDLEN